MVLTARFALPRHYAQEFQRIASKAVVRGANDRERMWNRLQYTEVTNVALAAMLDSAIPWDHLALTPEQLKTLRVRLGELARYMEAPSFDAYLQLRTSRLNWYILDQRTTRSSVKDVSAPQVAPITDQIARQQLGDIGAAWTNLHYTRQGKASLPQIVSVCREKIAEELTYTNIAFDFPNNPRIGKGMTVAVEHYNPGFAYGEKSLRRAYGPGDGPFFHLSLYARAEGSTNAGPIYVSLCWLPADRDWCLAGLITDKCLGIQTIF